MLITVRTCHSVQERRKHNSSCYLHFFVKTVIDCNHLAVDIVNGSSCEAIRSSLMSIQHPVVVCVNLLSAAGSKKFKSKSAKYDSAVKFFAAGSTE